jgi:hypothetical protein
MHNRARSRRESATTGARNLRRGVVQDAGRTASSGRWHVSGLFAAMAIGLFTTGCDWQASRPAEPNSAASRDVRTVADAPPRSSNALSAGQLPIGTVVQPGEVLQASPQPPDRTRGDVVPLHDFHGDTLVNPPHSNRGRFQDIDVHTPGGDGADRGIQLLNNSPSLPTVYGMSWNPEVNVSRTLPAPLHSASSTQLFVTGMPPGGTCIEATVLSIRSALSSQTDHLFGYYDWCGSPGRWQPYLTINSTFLNNYLRTMAGKTVMTVSIETVSGAQNPRCWYLDVYNYNWGTWEQFFSSCGTTTLFVTPTDQGWVQWETYDLIDTGVCPSIAGASALDIRFYDSSSGFGAAYPITNSSYSSKVDANHIGNSTGNMALCFSTGSYTFTYPWSSSPTNSWTAATPNP